MEQCRVNTQWHRVSKREPCRICKKPDWCTWAEGVGACCMRIDSGKPLKNGGWLHRFNADYVPVVQPLPVKRVAPAVDVGSMMRRWKAVTAPGMVCDLAASLSVTAQALDDLGAVYAPEHHAWAFAMRNGRTDLIGIRLRDGNGHKWAVTGSRQGLFLPVAALTRLPTDRIFICEGPTDTAAALSIGVFAIGRPSCNGCEDMVAEILTGIGASEAVVVTDNDGPGLQGAVKLMRLLQVRTAQFVPPAKDFREFVRLGGTAALVSALLSDCRWLTGKQRAAFSHGKILTTRGKTCQA